MTEFYFSSPPPTHTILKVKWSYPNDKGKECISKVFSPIYLVYYKMKTNGQPRNKIYQHLQIITLFFHSNKTKHFQQTDMQIIVHMIMQ